MSVPYRPETYQNVAPYLMVDGAAQLLEFLTKVFDAVEIRRFPDEHGRILHAETRIGDSVVMLADRPPNYAADTGQVHVYVPDVDTTYQRALEAGATSLQEPVKRDDADRRCGVKDPCGVTWWIATKVE